jgi:hypothetical protein
LYFFTSVARVSFTCCSHGRGTLALMITTLLRSLRMFIMRSNWPGSTVPLVPSCTITSCPSAPWSWSDWMTSTPAVNWRLSAASMPVTGWFPNMPSIVDFSCW